jgi:hypothetical protein
VSSTIVTIFRIFANPMICSPMPLLPDAADGK